MAVVATDVTNLIKTYYRGPLHDSIGDRNLWWNRVVNNRSIARKVDWAAQTITWSPLVEAGHGVGHRGANEYLPEGSPFTTSIASTGISRFYGTMSVDGLIEHIIAGNNEAAFGDYIKLQMQTIEDQMAFFLNFAMHGDGTGIVARINGASSGTTWTLSHPWETVGGTPDYAFGATQFLEHLNTPVVVLDGTTFAYKGARTISTIDWDNQQVTIPTALTVADNDVLVLGDANGYDYNNSPSGFRAFVANSGTVFNLAVSRRWGSHILNTTATPVAYEWDHLYRVAKVLGRNRMSGKSDCVVAVHPAICREHRDLYENDVRYTSRQFKYEKGQETPCIYVDGKKIELMEDPYLGYQEILGVNTKSMWVNEIRALDLDRNGGEFKTLQGKDARYAFWKLYYGIGADKLNDFARFDGVTVDTSYVDLLHENL